MIYHYLSWAYGNFTADTFMGRVGIYGVSVFYVLSGLTLYYVYFDKMKPSTEEIILFFKKRFFRIYPLLWLATAAAILISKKVPDVWDVLLNLTGLFGFIKWDTCFSTGVWSIGNELVFYVFFPVFILLVKSYRIVMVLFGMLLFSVYLYFAFVKLVPEVALADQWKNYVNPLNQVFIFLGGFLIGFFLNNIKINNLLSLLFILLGLGLFTFYPVAGNAINLVSGVNRLVFTAICFLVCIGFYKTTVALPAVIHKPLTLLGESSYSVYLLHPIVWGILGFIFKLLHLPEVLHPSFLKVVLSVICTLIVSYFVYEKFEKYFMKFAGRKKVCAG